MNHTRLSLLSVCVFLSITAFSLAATLDVGDGSGAPGEQASVVIALTGAPANSAGINATLTYDDSLLTPVEVRQGALTGNQTVEFNNVADAGFDQLRFVIYNNPAAAFTGTDGSVAIVVFAINPAAGVGASCPLTLITNIPGDALLNGTALADLTGLGVTPLTLDPGTFTVTASAYPNLQDFETTTGAQWAYGFGILGAAPTGTWTGSAMSITEDGNFLDFGNWSSVDPTMFPMTPGSVYHATWAVKSDQPVKGDTPDIRLRVNTSNDPTASEYSLKSSSLGADIMPGVDYQNYEMLFAANRTALSGQSFGLSFDLVEFGSGNGLATISLDSVQVRPPVLATTLRAGLSLIKTHNFAADAEGWAPAGQALLGIDTPPTGAYNAANQSIDLTIFGASDSFGHYDSPGAAPNGPLATIDQTKFYVIDYTISTDITPQTMVPDVRLRTTDEETQQWQYLISISGDAGLGAAMCPTPTPSVVSQFLYPHPAVNGNSMKTAFDVVNIFSGKATSGNLRLERVDVYEGLIANFPPGF